MTVLHKLSHTWYAQSDESRTLCLAMQAERTWVFGMKWYPIVGVQSRREILLEQRRIKATHRIESSLTQTISASVVGLVSLIPKQKTQKKLYSAALEFACSHSQDTHILIAHLQEQGWWLVATHHGTVVSQTDVWYVDRLKVNEHLNQLKTRFPNALIKEVIWHVSLQQPELIVTEDLADELYCLSKPVINSQPLLIITISPFLKASVAVGLMSMIVFCVLAYFWLNMPHAVFETNKSAGELLVNQSEVSSRYKVHDYDALLGLVEHWRVLPLDPSGWLLKRIDCEGRIEVFFCQALYVRQKPHANNAQLARALPQDWEMVANTIDQVSVVRDVSITASAIDWKTQKNEGDWLTPLQQRQAIFQRIELGAPESIPLAVSLTETPTYKRQIKISGPMRALSALSGFEQPIQWQHAALEILDETILDLTHSHFVLHLTGDLFVPS